MSHTCEICSKVCKNKVGLMLHKRIHEKDLKKELKEDQEVKFNITSTGENPKPSRTTLTVMLDAAWGSILEGENRFYLKQPENAKNEFGIPATELPIKEALETIKGYMNCGEAKGIIQNQINQL